MYDLWFACGYIVDQQQLSFSFLDVESCEIHGGCSQYCSFNEDVYTCKCAAGYVLNADNKTCRAKGKRRANSNLIVKVILLNVNSTQLQERNFDWKWKQVLVS